MISAFVIINCHFPFDTKIIHEISKLPSVTNVYRTEGRYDLIVKLTADTENKLNEVISADIKTIHGVDATFSLVIA